MAPASSTGCSWSPSTISRTRARSACCGCWRNSASRTSGALPAARCHHAACATGAARGAPLASRRCWRPTGMCWPNRGRSWNTCSSAHDLKPSPVAFARAAGRARAPALSPLDALRGMLGRCRRWLLGLVLARIRQAPRPFSPGRCARHRRQGHVRFRGPQTRVAPGLHESELGRHGWFAGARFSSAADIQMSFPSRPRSRGWWHLPRMRRSSNASVRARRTSARWSAAVRSSGWSRTPLHFDNGSWANSGRSGNRRTPAARCTAHSGRAWTPQPVAAPRLLAHSAEMAARLGFDSGRHRFPAFAEVVRRQRPLDGMQRFRQLRRASVRPLGGTSWARPRDFAGRGGQR